MYSDAEKVAEDGHTHSAYGLVRWFNDLAAGMNPSAGCDAHTAEAFSGWCWTEMAAHVLRGD